MRPSLSIVVPARNERDCIAELVKRLPCFYAPVEVIFVEGHSTDGTLEEIKRVVQTGWVGGKLRYITQEGIGKADAVWCGFNAASNDLLMILDSDLTITPEDTLILYETAVSRQGALISGSRMIYPMESGAMRTFNCIGNKLFAVLLSIVCGKRLTDTLCGSKCIMRTDFERLKQTPVFTKIIDPFGDFTLLLGARYLGIHIVEVPLKYLRRRYGKTKIRRFSDGWKLLKMVFAFLPIYISRQK